MADQWYYAQQGERLGPVSTDQIKQLAASGKLQPSDLVWKDGMAEWTAASEVEGLLPAARPSAPPPAAAPAGPPPMTGPPQLRPTGGAGLAETPLWKYLMIAGAGLMFFTSLLPWWGIYVTNEGSERNKLKKAQEVFSENGEWYVDHKVSWRDIAEVLHGPGIPEFGFVFGFPGGESKKTASDWLWGLNTGTGITAFIFSFLILPAAIVPFFVEAVRPWSWIGSAVSAIVGLILFILSLVWLFGCPGENVSGVLSQGMMIGLYLFFPASLLLLGGAVTDTVFGVMGFVSRLKSA